MTKIFNLVKKNFRSNKRQKNVKFKQINQIKFKHLFLIGKEKI